MLSITKIICDLSLNDIQNINQRKLDYITEHGDLSDGQELFLKFKEIKAPGLLGPIMFLSDEGITHDLYNLSIYNQKLKPDCPPETLLALSYLGQPDTLEVLVNYYKKVFTLNWTLHENVCKALLNYSCVDYSKEIYNVIDKCLSEVLFPEYAVLPAIKTNDPSLESRLLNHGQHTTTGACKGGILAALSLYGQYQRSLFKSAIRYPGWAAPFFQNTEELITMGMARLNIPLLELYLELIEDIDRDKPFVRENLFCIMKLLRAKLSEPSIYLIHIVKKQPEKLISIYESLFSLESDSGDIFHHLLKLLKRNKFKDEFTEELNEIKQNYKAALGN